MHTLDKGDGPFDLIWSEGSIFIVGFREGLAAWHSLLSPDGGLAVSEMAWLRSDPPEECRRFFAEVYPGMTTIAANLATIEACGYDVVGHFTEPESAWWDHYYLPLEARLRIVATAVRQRRGKAGHNRLHSEGDRDVSQVLRLLRQRVLPDATALSVISIHMLCWSKTPRACPMGSCSTLESESAAVYSGLPMNRIHSSFVALCTGVCIGIVLWVAAGCSSGGHSREPAFRVLVVASSDRDHAPMVARAESFLTGIARGEPLRPGLHAGPQSNQ